MKIPQQWITKKVGSLINEMPKSPYKVEDAITDGKFPFFTSGEEIKSLNKPLVDGEYLFLATGGVANVKYFSGKAAYSADTYTIGTEDINAKLFFYYLFHNLKHINYQFFLGSGLKHLQKKDFKKYEINIPKDHQEQLKIAEILSTIDDVIDKTEANIVKQKRIKQGLLQDLFHYGIDEKGNIRNEKTHKFKTVMLSNYEVGIPEEWESNVFDSLAISIDPQPDHRAPKEIIDGYPYIGIGDFSNDKIDFSKCRKVSFKAVQKQNNSFRLETGDIIFGKIGTIGNPRILSDIGINYALNANTILIKPNIRNSFVYWLLNTKFVNKYINDQISKTSQPAFGIQKIRLIPVVYPISVKEREKISIVMDTIQSSIVNEDLQKQKLILIKVGLLEDLLTGKIRVSHLLN